MSENRRFGNATLNQPVSSVYVRPMDRTREVFRVQRVQVFKKLRWEPSSYRVETESGYVFVVPKEYVDFDAEVDLTDF